LDFVASRADHVESVAKVTVSVLFDGGRPVDSIGEVQATVEDRWPV
jgi:hypothetical protein